MQFAELNAAALELRRSVRSFVGEDALGEIHIRPPARENDEASFMRLVNWSYVLLFEVGSITLPYLMRFPSASGPTKERVQEGRDIIHALRTWISHNVGFSSGRDAAISKRVSVWFLTWCNATEPRDEDAWRTCFRELCNEVGMIVQYCQDALAAIVRDGEERELIEELRRRLDRLWSTYRFDELVIESCTRLAVNVDVPRFRDQKLSKWREFLATVPDEDDPQRAVMRLIERDVIDHTSDVLPIGGEDVMDVLGLSPGPRVGDALRRARELFRSGIRDRRQLLERLVIDNQTSRREDDPDGAKGS